jgi:hypothetical protein
LVARAHQTCQCNVASCQCKVATIAATANMSFRPTWLRIRKARTSCIWLGIRASDVSRAAFPRRDDLHTSRPLRTVGPAVWERPCHSGEAPVRSTLAILVRHQLPRFTPHRRRLLPYIQLLRKLSDQRWWKEFWRRGHIWWRACIDISIQTCQSLFEPSYISVRYSTQPGFKNYNMWPTRKYVKDAQLCTEKRTMHGQDPGKNIEGRNQYQIADLWWHRSLHQWWWHIQETQVAYGGRRWLSHGLTQWL